MVPLIEWEGGSVSEKVLSLVRPPVGAVGELLLFNGGDQPVELLWRLAGASAWESLALAPGEARQCILEKNT